MALGQNGNRGIDATEKKVPVELVEEIRKFLREIQATKGILFGSRAKGEEISTSDVDLVVLADHFEGVPFPRRMIFLHEHWNLPFFLEGLPYTPEEFGRLSKTRGVVRAALEEGIEILP